MVVMMAVSKAFLWAAMTDLKVAQMVVMMAGAWVDEKVGWLVDVLV